ncbi:MAG: hypothetical protein ACAH80_16945 [Alphaproteobacteria bacterium]
MDIEQRLAAIEARNLKVTADKVWETSLMRRLSIAAMTYVCACLTFILLIPTAQWYLTAFVPTGGYVLSTLGLPWLRERWQKSHGYMV